MIDTTDLIEPLDYMILGALPDEGSLIMGIYPDGKTVQDIRKNVFKNNISSTSLSPRFIILRTKGLLKAMKGVGTDGLQIYQRTPQGKAVFKTWDAAHNSNGGSDGSHHEDSEES